jgi:nucleotidyltransferase substrate binding protein (TIGR01987 family)
MTKLKNLIQNLIKANQRLKEAVKSKPTRMNKDATIQRFEFTFELAWKTIQAYMEDQGFSCKSPKSCIREGARLEVIDNPMSWFDYLNARNFIAHTYNEKQADKVYRQARKFSKEINELLTKIKS